MARIARAGLWSAMLVLVLWAGTAVAQDRKDLVGVWRGQVPAAFGLTQVELILQENGEYSSATLAQGVMSRHWGQWRLVSGVLRLDIKGAEPREWCGPLGCSPIVWPEGETWPFEMPDPNTLRTASGTLYRAR